MACSRVETDADDLHLVLGEVAHAVTQSACFLRAAWGVVLRIKIEQHHLFADFVGEFPRLAVLVFPFDQRGRVPDFGG
jgi:hypothetical protein